jgi:D-glycerate 3-kinase
VPKDELTHEFTDYPAYELYTDVLRKGIFQQTGKQLRLTVDKHRKVEEVEMQ